MLYSIEWRNETLFQFFFCITLLQREHFQVSKRLHTGYSRNSLIPLFLILRISNSRTHRKREKISLQSQFIIEFLKRNFPIAGIFFTFMCAHKWKNWFIVNREKYFFCVCVCVKYKSITRSSAKGSNPARQLIGVELMVKLHICVWWSHHLFNRRKSLTFH
jgi:hypothetical protein